MAKYLGNRPTAVPLTSADIQDGVITASDLAENSVDSSELVDGSVDLSHLSASGTKSSSTYFRGDNSFATISAGTALTGSTNNQLTTVTGANAISGEANLTFDGTDLTVATGNVVMGTSGKGIDFSATSGTGTSEILDDYEEGTWTPSLNYAGTTTGVTHEVQNGYYTKIGNRVTVRFSCRVDAKGSGTGHARFSGLPFTGVNAGWDEHAVNLFYDNTSDCWDLVGLLGTTHISLYYHADAGTGMNPAYKAQWTDDFQVFGEGTYSTAS